MPENPLPKEGMMTHGEFEKWVAGKVAEVPRDPSALRREAEGWRAYSRHVESHPGDYQDAAWEIALGEKLAERFEAAASEIEAAK